MKKEEITLKNTKAEILDALNAALEREKKLSTVKSNPEKEEEKKKIEKAIDNSKENVSKNIFSNELIQKFNDLEIAIKAEEERLQNLYGVDKELSSLVTTMNAAKDVMAKLEEDKKNKTEELNNNIKELEEEYKTKTEELKKEYEIEAKNLKMLRDRENEEYNYKLKRDREISNNKWEDEKKLREKTLSIKEEETNKLLEEAKKQENHIKELETKVEEIPNLLIKEYALQHQLIPIEFMPQFILNRYKMLLTY